MNGYYAPQWTKLGGQNKEEVTTNPFTLFAKWATHAPVRQSDPDRQQVVTSQPSPWWSNITDGWPAQFNKRTQELPASRASRRCESSYFSAASLLRLEWGPEQALLAIINSLTHIPFFFFFLQRKGDRRASGTPVLQKPSTLCHIPFSLKRKMTFPFDFPGVLCLREGLGESECVGSTFPSRSLTKIWMGAAPPTVSQLTIKVTPYHNSVPRRLMKFKPSLNGIPSSTSSRHSILFPHTDTVH